MKPRFIIAGGGTGGHIFPAVAIANALKQQCPGAEFLFVGAKGKMEMEKVPQAGYAIEGLDIAGFNRSSLIKNIGLPLKLLKSFFQVRSIFSRFRPDAVIGVGGYSSFPVLRYAQARGIPTFIHESNSFAGKSNILLGKKATKIFVAIDGMEKFFPAEKIMISGNPVRAAICSGTASREESVRFFGLDPARNILLVVGGSLGAKGINEAIDAGLDRLLENGLQLIWQTGKPFAEQARRRCTGRQGVWVNDFITRMELAYSAADLMVSRSGAMSVSEICVVAKPVVFVPFPFAAEDHQTVNARKLADRQAALLVSDSEAGKALVPAVLALAADPEKRRAMTNRLRDLAVTDADTRIAEEIRRCLGLMDETNG